MQTSLSEEELDPGEGLKTWLRMVGRTLYTKKCKDLRVKTNIIHEKRFLQTFCKLALLEER